jgi:DHA1 family bicyclomycin/chloramphenicol resistance-like MFS transporter
MAAVSRTLVLLLGALTAFGPLTIDMYLPSLPALSDAFDAPASRVQYTLASFFIGLAVGQAFYGPLSDAFGRKPPLYVGLVMYLLATLGCVFAPNVDTMIVLRFFQAIGGCAGMVIARAVVRDFVVGQEAARIFSTLMLVMGVAPILAPVAGGYLLDWFGWQSIFLALAAFGLVCLLTAAVRLPETLPPAKRRRADIGTALRAYGTLLRDRHFMGFSLSGGLAMAGMFTYITASPHLFIEVYGLSPQAYSWLFGVNAAGLIGASQVNRYLLRTWSLYQVLRLGLAIYLAATLAFLGAGLTGNAPLWILLIPLFIALAALGLVAPNASAAALSGDPRTAGSASSLTGTVPFLTGAAAGALVGVLPDTSAASLAAVMTLCALGGYVAHAALVGSTTPPSADVR